jgi:hypothetical protein
MTILISSESGIDGGNVDIMTLLEKQVGAETPKFIEWNVRDAVCWMLVEEL